VHCNNSRDEFGSGADRHANFDAGTIDPQALVAVVRAAGAPVVCETPEPGLAADIAWLRDQTQPLRPARGVSSGGPDSAGSTTAGPRPKRPTCGL
jgi:hypothetical protein